MSAEFLAIKSLLRNNVNIAKINELIAANPAVVTEMDYSENLLMIALHRRLPYKIVKKFINDESVKQTDLDGDIALCYALFMFYDHPKLFRKLIIPGSLTRTHS